MRIVFLVGKYSIITRVSVKAYAPKKIRYNELCIFKVKIGGRINRSW
jgi:hypothetical protein